jgi:hypothetical protein
MRTHTLKAILNSAARAIGLLLFGAVVAFGQQQVNLTAGPATATLPDGKAVPMWGYSCDATQPASTATCAALKKGVTSSLIWSPVVITVPTGQSLQINLTNNLSFGGNSIPTSIMIVGQIGGGLGTPGGFTAPVDHSGAQSSTTWPIAGGPGSPINPPTQGPRVRSFATEVVVGTPGQLCWGPACTTPSPALNPGTYLIESGSHPSIQGPMGLYGILVVTTAPVGATAGTAYPAVAYNADVPVLLSEIDPVQNAAVQAAVGTAGFDEATVWTNTCGAANTCYPPAVNYSPLYYLINGTAFDKTIPSNSQFSVAPTTGVAGSVLVRLVNAGLRMHVPSIVGSTTTTTVGTPPVTTTPAGFSLIAEDGNVLPGVPRVQSEVFMAAGKTYDVMINSPAAGGTALPIYDRELSLSGGGVNRDSGMLAYISVNGAAVPVAAAAATANPDTYNSLVAGQTFTVSDPSKGVIANDVNVYGVQLNAAVAATGGTVTLNGDGTFTFAATASTGSFGYCANGTTTICTTVTLGAAAFASGVPTAGNTAFTASNAAHLAVGTPGVLSNATDPNHLPLTVLTSSVVGSSGLAVVPDANGGFAATASAPGTYTFTYQVQNSLGKVSNTATATLTFPTGAGLIVNVKDPVNNIAITDYRWIIEEDRTFFIDPANTTTNPVGAAPLDCTLNPAACTVPPTFGVNFHTSYMPVVATGCTGGVGFTGTILACEAGQQSLGAPVVCDVGNGVCRPGNQQTPVDPSQVVLDPHRRYYISVLSGDAGNPFGAAYGGAPDCSTAGVAAGKCGHGMGGAPVIPTCTAGVCTFSPVTVLVEPTPLTPSKLSVFVFEDDTPLNGEQDGGGGTGAVNTNFEPGLGHFNITLFDDAGGSGDATGQMTYDMFNQPLVNSLAGTIDPTTGFDACPVSVNPRDPSDPTSTGITGTIVVCPEYENGKDSTGAYVPSPLAGQAVVANLMPGRYGVVATPGADRIARGEEWLQTNTLDGQKAHDSFLRVGEPSFFQEYGPAGYHVSIGFANPAIINARYAGVCNGTDPTGLSGNCRNKVTGMVTTERMSRTPDERLYSSGTRDSFSFTQCYVSFGDPDGEDFAFTKCNADGTFEFDNMPDGNWRITSFDQWNDQLVDGLSTPVGLSGGGTTNVVIAANQWQANIYTSTFFDANKNGVRDTDEEGLALVATNIRFRDGSFSNFNNTDLQGNAGFNEVFPLFSWYVVETDTTRYKNTGTHVVYDAGGPADGTCDSTTAPCGSSTIGANMANTFESVSVPNALRVPGAVYCGGADCSGKSIAAGPASSDATCTTNVSTGVTSCTAPLSTGRIDPPSVLTEGWQGYSGQNSFLEFGKTPYVPGENGGIKGHVIYASTRPFDDPQLLLQTSWEPLVPNVTINLYKEGFAADNVTPTLTLIDTTTTSSWDNWAQGFRTDGNPNMNCPGQGRESGTNADLFFFSLFNQPNYLDLYNSVHNGTTLHTIPNNSQFKCYDGMHNWNQLQPAPYDGYYQFPSVTAVDNVTGEPTGTNCTLCTTNPDTTDFFRNGKPMLPAGKYVVEVVVPPGYELVKEEDKNILIGDNYIAPVTQEFGGLGNIFILPDQAAVGSTFNANNPQNPTTDLGRPTLPQGEGDTGSVEQYWPCVGEARMVPDYISLFPGSLEVAPFAGATRNLCDRKEVTLEDQMSALAKFYIFTSTHAAAHFTGVITDDYTSEFDPFSPQFGEKFSPPDMPISIKDFNGNEIARTYSDHWGDYDGLQYSTWEVNPPNPTGYAPTMMVVCMNDPGTGVTPDPLFNPDYSQFCYEIPFMPGQTQYMDTPVVPTAGFAGAGYNNVDCSYPDLTPAISEVDGDGVGPYVSATGHTLTIHSLGDQTVQNYAYSGPSATTAPFNQKTVTRHYGFGTAKGTVTIGGVAVPPASINWSDTLITLPVPTSIPNCSVQQQAQYGGSTAKCGELVITTSTGKQTIDSITVTVGGKAPTRIAPGGTIQAAIDAAKPGDLIIVPPGVYNEMVVMWKPVRLQGVGAASSVINANTHPAGKLDIWRQRVNCLFGLALNGQPMSGSNPYDPSGAAHCVTGQWFGFTAFNGNEPQIDRLPLEATVGWDAELNGNLAEMLQEPSLMGALEGAGITVLGKGVRFPNGTNPFDSTLLAGFPTGTTLLTSSSCTTSRSNQTNPFPSNFWCNPSSIDGLGITDSSQGGGAVFVHGWGHNLQIANDRIYNNAGTLSGGINVGQGEFAPAIVKGSGTNAPPYENDNGNFCAQSTVFTGAQEPYCDNVNVNIHNNYVVRNSSTGDELFSATPAGAGGVSICTGADYYLFNFNWVCGNLSSGDGGGFGHIGFSYNGDIEHNSFLFNQSTNPTIPTNGGGLIIMGTPDQDIVCNNNPNLDADCSALTGTVTAVAVTTGGSGYTTGNTTVHFTGGGGTGATATVTVARVGGRNGVIVSVNITNPGSGYTSAPTVTFTSATGTGAAAVATTVQAGVSPSDGVGPALVINANLIQGNAAESGTGGGIAFQSVNGTDVVSFPTTSSRWYNPKVTNNIIVDNVAGWDGGGVSLVDSLDMDIVNNTIASNNSTASAGPLFDTLGAPLASQSGTNCMAPTTTASCPQVAGLVVLQNSAILKANLPGVVNCPTGHFQGASGTNGTCRNFSYPKLENDLFWQNGTYYIGVGSLGGGNLNQQNIVTLFNSFSTTPAPSQPQARATTAHGAGVTITGGTGACVATSYWDIGVRGDSSPTTHESGVTLNPNDSDLTITTGYNATNNQAGKTNPNFISQYCDGSRVPPEFGGSGWQVPPGIADATVPNPVFNLTPTATVDEGNNWINIQWGPLSMVYTSATSALNGTVLGNYGPADTGSLAVGQVRCGDGTTSYSDAPSLDFYGNSRNKSASCPSAGSHRVDAGAVEFTATPVLTASVSPSALTFGNWHTGSTSNGQVVTVTNTGNTDLAGGIFTFSAGIPYSMTRTCGATLTQGSSCTITVRFVAPATAGTYTGTLNIAYTGATVTPASVSLTGTSVATRAALTIAPGSVTITVATPILNLGTGTANVTVTNNAASTVGAAITTTTITAAGSGPLTWNFAVDGASNCAGAGLAPGASCTIVVRFNNVSSATGVDHAGTLTITDDATGTPQTVSLTGHANP